MKAITGTWNTLTDTFTAITRYRPAGIYPLLASIVVLFVTLVVLVPLFTGVLGLAQQGMPWWLCFGLVTYLAYGLLYFISTVGNVMLVLQIGGQLDGRTPVSMSALFARTMAQLPTMIHYTVVATALSVASILARVGISPLFGGLIAPRVGDKLWQRFHRLSYKIPLQLVVPVIAFAQPPPRQLFAQSEALVKTTWGERVKPAHGMGLLTLVALLLVMLYAIPTLQQGLATENAELRWLGLCVTLLIIGAYTQCNAVVNAIFALAAYRYATAQKSDLFPSDPSYAEQAFVNAQNSPTVGETRPVALTKPSTVGNQDPAS